MPRSTTSAFTEPDEFQAAMHGLGSLGQYGTAPGDFRAKLTQVSLYRLRLAVVEESLPRIGFLAVPESEVMISFPSGSRPAPIWAGIRPRAGELVAIGPGHRVHVRTEGPSRWGAIWFPTRELTNYFHEMTERTLTISPFVQLWRPPAAAVRRFQHFHSAAIRSAEVRPSNIVSMEAAHGSEQQLIEAIVECLSEGLPDGQRPARRRHPAMMARFEELLRSRAPGNLRVDSFGAAIGVSDRLLRLRCKEELGMSPTMYVRLRALHMVHDVLRRRDMGAASLSSSARSHGFRQLGRFAAAYRRLFGELPSATLRRDLDRSVVLRRPRPP